MSDPLEHTPYSTAVVTVSFGSERVLGAFLDSIDSASAEPVELIVADNRGSGDGTVERLTTAAFGTYLPMTGNLGYGGAINAVVSALADSVDWVLISNPDVVLHDHAIDLLIGRIMEDERIGAVGPAILTADGDLYPSARSVPSLRTGIGHALFGNLWASNPWTRAYRNELAIPPGSRDAGWLSGACLLVRRSAFDQIDGFDPGYFMYFEDVDLGFRLNRAGYRNVYEPRATVTHSGAHSTSEDSAAMIGAHHASARRFLERRYSGPLLWPVRTALTASLFVRSALVRRRVRP